MRNTESGMALKAWVRALERTAPIERQPHVTLPSLVSAWADRSGDAPALLSRDSALTYRALAALAHRYSHWALAQDIRPGDVIALLMPNGPDYIAAWLGLTRVGAVVALLNTQLTGDSLAHAMRIVSPSALIVAAPLAEAWIAIRSRLSPLDAWVHGDSATDLKPLHGALQRVGDSALSERDCALPSIDDWALCIYTSGTSGMPKAARLSHYRLMQWSHWFAGLMDTRPADRLYNCLPLYHSVGGVVATGATLVGGGAVILRPHFSASEFWRDIRDEGCTIFQYIGELCRYLVDSPADESSTRHSLRLACGNGLRADVWTVFRERFRIPQILEYYASTEGNVSLYNCEGQVGAVGRIPPFLAHRVPVALVKVDAETGEPQRDAEGFCQRCAVDEPGLALGRIPDAPGQRTGRFEGYADAAASAAKLLHGVFTAGDTWYSTGDLMRRDAKGFFHFVDRLGDSFRWKGENVSASEVMAVIARCEGVIDGVVYGVSVPGADGRAGMAALVVEPGFDIAALRKALQLQLPDYARPVVIRLVAGLEMTATHKPKKQALIAAGFDPEQVGDALHVDDRRQQAYRPLDAALHAEIVAGHFRL